MRADEYPLEDAVTRVLRNAQRYRTPGSPMRIVLTSTGSEARVASANLGPAAPYGLIERIFEHGVSDQEGATAAGRRDQGRPRWT